jgi:hypothetical protein
MNGNVSPFVGKSPIFTDKLNSVWEAKSIVVPKHTKP